MRRIGHILGPDAPSSRSEAEIDYIARALIMPFEAVKQMLEATDYGNLDTNGKRRFVHRVSETFQVPVQHAALRIREVRELMSAGYGKSAK